MKALPLNDAVRIPYTHPVVRDLAWVMVSPGLLKTPPVGQALVSDEICHQFYASHQDHLSALDENPAPLLALLSKSKSHRLGIYFEWLLRYWLQNILQVQQLGHNIPVFQARKTGGKRTLGEFDFLFQMDETPSIQQWEATVKFYLQKINDQGEPYWIGPGDQDRLDIKLARLFQHQLKLSELAEAKACLLGRGAEAVQPAGFIKGYLFYPLAEDGTFSPHPASDNAVLPCRLSPRHNKGWWFHWRERSIPGAASDARWLVLAKSRWLSPVREKRNETILLDEVGLAAHCEKYFRQQNRPLLVAELQWQADVWQEISRGFVLAPE